MWAEELGVCTVRVSAVAVLSMSAQTHNKQTQPYHIRTRANCRLAGMLVICLYQCLVVDTSQIGTAFELLTMYVPVCLLVLSKIRAMAMGGGTVLVEPLYISQTPFGWLKLS